MQGFWCDGRRYIVATGAPSPAWLIFLRTERNCAGIDTRPLASSLFWWVPIKRAIRTRVPFVLSGSVVGRLGGDRAVALRQETAPSRLPLWMMVHRGQAWDSMGELGTSKELAPFWEESLENFPAR